MERVVACGSDLLLTNPRNEGAITGTFSALQWAAFKGNTAMVRLLLDRGVEKDAGVPFGLLGYTHDVSCWTRPLHIAVYKGHDAVVRLLLDRGADISTPEGAIETLVSLAASKGHEAVVRLLLERGADVNEPGVGLMGYRPLQRAVSCGHEGVVKLLLEKGADPNAPQGNITLFFGLVCSPRHPESWGEAWERILRLLLEYGADPTIPDNCGRSPRYWAQIRDQRLYGIISEKYPWHGVGFEYWQSRSYGELVDASKRTTRKPRTERKQCYGEWRVRRWCRRKQISAKMDCIRVFRSLSGVFIKDSECV